MKKPILALVPSAYNTSKLYTPIPINGDGDFTFTRSTTATRINKDGLLEDVAINTPRLDYLKDKNCPTLLLEGASTNLMTDSADFTVWNDILVTVDSNVVIAPDGTIEADKVTRTTTSGNYISDFLNKSASALTYTSSIFVKRGNTDELAIRSQGSYPARIDLRYNFATNSIYFVNPLSGFLFIDSKVENYPDGWVRLSWTFTTDADTILTAISLSPRLTSGSTDSNDTSDDAFCYFWGGQCEESNIVTSYIPTTGSSVTRNLESCIDAGSLSLFDISEGTFFIDIVPNKSDETYYISLNSGASDNRVLFVWSGSTLSFRVVQNGLSVTYDNGAVYGERQRLAISWNSAETKSYLNGVLVSTQSLTGHPVGLSKVNYAIYTGTVNFFEGCTYGLKVYNEVLTDAEAIELTK
ncbi:LamG domain-containing protein [Akkermansiaceae bacterium]|nr:LamG domain-containing protein [Akkermansiaceae bacterium]